MVFSLVIVLGVCGSPGKNHRRNRQNIWDPGNSSTKNPPARGPSPAPTLPQVSFSDASSKPSLTSKLCQEKVSKIQKRADAGPRHPFSGVRTLSGGPPGNSRFHTAGASASRVLSQLLPQHRLKTSVHFPEAENAPLINSRN